MATMNISVPDPMKDWVQDQIEGGKYASSSDYVRDLIILEQPVSMPAKANLPALVNLFGGLGQESRVGSG